MSTAGRGDPTAFESWHGEVGCLLLHGFPGSPAEVRELGAYLGERGVSVIAPCLPGHGQKAEALQGIHWGDWLRAAAAEARRLREHGRWVFAVGLSMGGALALYLTAQIPIDGVVAICPPVQSRNPLFRWTPLAKHLLRWTELGEDKDLADPESAQRHCYYTRVPVAAVAETYHLARAVWQAAPYIFAPALLIQSRNDRTLRPRGAEALLERLGTEQKRLIWLERCGHNALVDVERESVFAAVWAFIDECVQSGPPAGRSAGEMSQ